MKKKILLCILFLIICFFSMNTVEAKKYKKAEYDTGACIDDFGTIKVTGTGYSNFVGGRIFYSNKTKTVDQSTKEETVTFDVEAAARVNYDITEIHYSIGSKLGYSCSGVIKGKAVENNNGSVNLTVTIDKLWVNNMSFWAKSVSRTYSSKSDTTKSNMINVNRKMTDKELEEINKELEIGEGETLQCKTLQELLDKYWTWVMILAPIATMILITIDFVSPILSGDSADALKKAGNRSFKRAIALVILLMLPVITNLLFGLFGVETCF